MKPWFSTKLPTVCLLIVITVLSSTQYATARDPDPHHTIWVQLESEPAGATIYALPEDELAEPTIEIGTTPYVVAVDLSWKSGVFGRNWHRLVVSSPGNICRAVQHPDKNYDIVLSFLAVKDGYVDKRVQQLATIVKHPGKGWSGEAGWPKKAVIKVPLEREKVSTAKKAPAKKRARRVIVANSEEATGDGTSGTLEVRANVRGARIYVDKNYVGDVPMQVIVKEGPHVIEVRKDGYSSATRAIYVSHDAEVTYDAKLLPR